jgi:hypothetical protein
MMSEENKYTLDNMINSAVMQEPLEFQQAFDDEILDRIRTAVQNKKVEIAQQIYNYEPEAELEQEQEDSSEEEDYGQGS